MVQSNRQLDILNQTEEKKIDHCLIHSGRCADLPECRNETDTECIDRWCNDIRLMITDTRDSGRAVFEKRE